MNEDDFWFWFKLAVVAWLGFAIGGAVVFAVFFPAQWWVGLVTAVGALVISVLYVLSGVIILAPGEIALKYVLGQYTGRLYKGEWLIALPRFMKVRLYLLGELTKGVGARSETEVQKSITVSDDGRVVSDETQVIRRSFTSIENSHLPPWLEEKIVPIVAAEEGKTTMEKVRTFLKDHKSNTQVAAPIQIIYGWMIRQESAEGFATSRKCRRDHRTSRCKGNQRTVPHDQLVNRTGIRKGDQPAYLRANPIDDW